jgi:hypothetical protein
MAEGLLDVEEEEEEEEEGNSIENKWLNWSRGKANGNGWIWMGMGGREAD